MRLSERQQEVAFGLSLLMMVALGFAGGEVMVRVADAVGARDQRTEFWVDLRQAIMTPSKNNQESVFVPGTTFGNITINQQGFRGPPLAMPKPANVFRVAFLGNSKLFSASLDEDETIPARTIAWLNRSATRCRFDYYNGAGPDFGIELLRDRVLPRAIDFDTDLFVLLVGDLREVVQIIESRRAVETTFLPKSDMLEDHSRLWRRLKLRFAMESQSRQSARSDWRDRLPEPVLADAYFALLDGLAGDLRDNGKPVAAIAYRGQLRSSSSPETIERHAVVVQSRIRGLDAREIAEVSDMVVHLLETFSARHGWTFADPIAQVPTDDRFFGDPAHLTADGTAIVGRHLAPILQEIARPKCD